MEQIFDDEDEFEEVNELWVTAKVQGKAVMFCLDSGASRVILKSVQYWLVPEERRPKLTSKNVVLRHVDDTKVQIDGVAPMNLRVGECVLQIQVYVSPVSDNLLGLNFLRNSCAMIDLDKLQLQLVIGSQRIDCRTQDDEPLYARI